MSPRQDNSSAKVKPWRVPGRIAYIVSHSYPYSSNGYAVRTHGIATALHQHGHSVIVINRPGRPWDISGFADPAFPYHQDIDGVRYLFTREPSRRGLSAEAWRQAATEALQASLRVFKPSLVMAASNWENALPACLAAQALELPFFYEVRGFWEITRVSREPEWAQSAEYREAVERETWVAQQAERVFTLNGLMRDELVRRGLPAEKIKLVPNGVGEMPDLARPAKLTREQMGISSRYVVGYVGSFSPYEGLEDLIRAAARLVQEGMDLSVLLVGSGSPSGLVNGGCSESQRYRQLGDELGLGERLCMPGRVCQDQLGDYYRLIDLVVIPRRSTLVTELVSPIKPFEVAAHGKALLVSAVGPLEEFAREAEAELFRAGDSVDLKRKMDALIRDQSRRRAGGEGIRRCIEHAGRFSSRIAVITASVESVCSFDPNRCLRKKYEHRAGFASPTSASSASRAQPYRIANAPEFSAPTPRTARQPRRSTSLKSYTCQPSLRVPKQELSGQAHSIRFDYETPFEILEPVVPNQQYSFTLNCSARVSNKKGIVADITFIREDGNVVPKPYPGYASSKSFGSYFYVRVHESGHAQSQRYILVTPDHSAQILIKLIPFSVKSDVAISRDYALMPIEKDCPVNRTGTSPYSQSFKQILHEAAEIPDSNGTEYYSKHDFRIGVISDIYMYNFYKDVCETVYYLSPSNYSEILDKGLDIVIYTTCWKGIENEEWRGVKFREKPKKALEAILNFAKINRIKTVFQSIEDPSNFDYFLPIARQFDYILTTDTDCIDRYKQELGHDRVFYGEYGVNPQLNNPIGCRRNIRNAAFFAGSYPKRYKKRCDDMEIIFDSILQSEGELLIADRNFEQSSDDLSYPQRFQSCVLPPVDHALLQKLHKLFRYNLNFNSIKQSPSMCAMRVYELQAQGNGLISSYANSVFNKFPGVRLVPYQQGMYFDFGTDETWEEYRANISNIREVLNSRSSYQVVATLLQNIGFTCSVKKEVTIAVICAEKTDSVLRSYDSQVYSDKVLFEEKELGNWDELKKNNKIGYFCWFSENNNYEANYLIDLLNGFKYTDCYYITKNSYFDTEGRLVFGNEHEYTDYCSGKELTLFSSRYFSPLQFLSYPEAQSFGLRNGYSIDPFEMNFIRNARQYFPQPSRYQLSVIVPVYNNGRFLVGKCIPSLQRNNLWQQMEVLLVDDGSTDQKTRSTLEFLAAIYPNVRVKFNKDGGSGSASRPRNQGIDMATASLITFLDPDNEIAPGAYDLLIDLYSEANTSSTEPVEFISGFHVKVGDGVKTIGRHTSKRLSVIQDLKGAYFERGRFPIIATQSAVIAKRFLDDNEIRFVERSAGQDTLFGWELAAKAKCGGFSGDAHIIYYADRSDSITNQVDESYFEKKLILEKAQYQFLKGSGLLESFIANHFEGFIKNWYLEKLKLAEPAKVARCTEILRQICNIYQKNFDEFSQ